MKLIDLYMDDHFSIEYYLKTTFNDSSIIDFCNENKININYIGFVKLIENQNIEHIVTTNITKLSQNGYRYITVSKVNDEENTIMDYKKYPTFNFIELHVVYNNISIKISKQYPDLEYIYTILPTNITVHYIAKKVENGNNRYKFEKNHTFNHTFNTNNVISIINYNNEPFYYECEKNTIIYNGTDSLKLVPKNCISLKFNHYYDEIIKPNILSNIEEIIFGPCFNTIINHNVFPRTLKKIIFGQYFNKEFFPNILPPNLIELYFGANYNQIILKDVLPLSLKKLKFGKYYKQSIVTKFPDLDELYFFHKYNQIIIKEYIPYCIKILKIPRKCVLGDLQIVGTIRYT